MKYLAPLVCSYLLVSTALAQDYSSFTQTIANLGGAKSPDEVNKLWNDLIESVSIPVVYEDSVAFLYRGEANSVAWMGDFNGWGYNKSFNNKGKRIPQTDIWVLKSAFPKDARLDYKIVVNDVNWILDPLNTDQQWSGVGGGSPNSELRMPEWKEDPLTFSAVPGSKHGKVERDVLYNSATLGYQVMYSV
ncbi:MAG: hypothetical protein ACOYXT_29685, partial [Bacteroidota bacterium]